MGNDASKIKTLQILKVNENSVSHKNNLLPFMHTIIKYNDKPIKTNLDALEINKEWENDDLILEIRDLRTDTDFSLIIPKKNGEKLGMNIKYHDDIIKLFTVKILDIVPGSPAERCGLVKSDYILGVENVSCENENELLKYIECRKKAGMPLLVFNPELNFIRKVEFKVPSGLGFFGCEIGLGILYRIPADGRNISMEFNKDKINEELDKLRKKQEEEENYSESELTNKDQDVMSETYKEKTNLSNASKKETVKDEEIFVDDVNEGVTKDNDENKDSKINTSLYDKEIKKQPEERLNEDQIQNGSKLLDDEGKRINSKESRIHESFKSKIREENDIKSLQNDLEKDGKEEVLKKPEDQENEEDNLMHKNNGKVGSKIKNSVSDFKTKVLEENHKENGINREHTNEDKDLSGVDEKSISRGKENKEEFFDKSPNEMIKPELSSQGTKLQNFDKNEPIIEKENKSEKVGSYQEKENKSSAHDVETEKTPDINDSKEKEENLSKNKVAINNLSSRKLEDDVVKGNESKSEDQNVLKSTQKTSILDQEDMDKDKKSLDVADKKTQIKEHLSKLDQKKANDDLFKRENESEKLKNEDMKKTEEKINNNSFDKKPDLDKIETTKKIDKSLSGINKIDETGRKEEAKSHQDKYDNPEDIVNNKSEEKPIPEQDRSEKVKDSIENESLNSLISEVDRSSKIKHDTADNKDDLSDIKDMTSKPKNNTEERKGDKASTSNKSHGLGKTPEREDKDRSSLENPGSVVENREEKEEIKSKDKSCKTKENKVEDELSSFNSEDMQKKKMNSEILKSKDKSYKAVESEDKNQSNKPGDLSSGETSNDVLTSKDKSDKISKTDKNSDEISLEKNPFSNQQDVTKKVDDRSISSVENKSDRIKDLYAKKETFLDEKNPDKLSDAFQNDKISDRSEAHEKVKEISQNNLNKAKDGSYNETVEHLSDGKNIDILSNKDENQFQNIGNKSIEANGIVREGSKILEENTKLTNKIDGLSDDMDRTDGLKIDLKSEQIKNSTGNGSGRETTPIEGELKNHESTLKNDSKLSTQDILKGKEKFDASSIKKNEEIGISEEGKNINQSDPIQKTKSLTDPSKAFDKEKKILDDIDKNESNKPNEHTEKMENDKNELKDKVKINESSEFAKDTLSNQKIETDKLNNKDDQKSEIFKNNLISNSGKNYQSKLQDSLQKQETIRITNQDIAEESKKQEQSEKNKSDDSLKIKDDELFEEKQNEKVTVLKNIQSFSSYRESVIEKDGNLDSFESQKKNFNIPDQRISNTKDPENSMSTEITKNQITESSNKNFKNDTISPNKDVEDTKHFNRMSDGGDLSYKNKNKTNFSELQTSEQREIGKKSEFLDGRSLSKDKSSKFKNINKKESPDSTLLEDTSKKSSIKDTKNKIPEDLSLVNKTVSSLIEKFEKSSHKLDKQPSNIPDHSSFDTITLNRQLNDILESSRDESITLTPYKIQLSDESSIENYFNDSDGSKDEKKITSKINEDNTGKKNHQVSKSTKLSEKIRENVYSKDENSFNAREEFKKDLSGKSKKVDGNVSDSKLKKDEKSEISASSGPDYFENKKDNSENKARVNDLGMEKTKLIKDTSSKANLKRSSFIEDLSSERNEVYDKHQDTKVEAFKTLDGSKLKESGKNLNMEEKAKLKDGNDENGFNPEENSKEEKNIEELNKDVDDILKNLKNNSKSLESKNKVSLKAEQDKSTEFKSTHKDLKKENSEIPVDFGDSSGQKINLESLKSKANISEKENTGYQESKGNSYIATNEKNESVKNLSYKSREPKENKNAHQSNSLKKSFLDNRSLENEELGSKPKVFHPEEMKENYEEKTQYQDFISSIERHKIVTSQEENIEKLHGNFEDKTFVSDLVSDSHIQSIEEALKNEDEDIQENEKMSTKSPENTEKIIEESLKKGKQNTTLTSSLKNLSGAKNKMFNNNGSKDEHPDTLKGGRKMYSSRKEEQLDTGSLQPLDNEQKIIDKDEGYESKNQKDLSSFGRESERSASTVLAKDVSASENSDRSNFIDMNTISSDLANKSKEDQFINANDNMAHLKSSHKESNFIGKPIQDQIKDRIKSKLEDQIKVKLVDKEKESKTLKKESHEESFALASNIERIRNNLSEEMKERNIEPSEAIKDEELTFDEPSRKDLDHNVEDILEQEIKNKNISVDTNVTRMDIFDSFEDEGTINKERSSTENKGSLSSRRLDEKIDSGVKFNDFNDRKKHFDLLDEPESELILSSMNVHKIGDSNEPRNNKNQILDLLNNEDDEAFELSEMNVHKE